MSFLEQDVVTRLKISHASHAYMLLQSLHRIGTVNDSWFMDELEDTFRLLQSTNARRSFGTKSKLLSVKKSAAERSHSCLPAIRGTVITGCGVSTLQPSLYMILHICMQRLLQLPKYRIRKTETWIWEKSAVWKNTTTFSS